MSIGRGRANGCVACSARMKGPAKANLGHQDRGAQTTRPGASAERDAPKRGYRQAQRQSSVTFPAERIETIDRTEGAKRRLQVLTTTSGIAIVEAGAAGDRGQRATGAGESRQIWMTREGRGAGHDRMTAVEWWSAHLEEACGGVGARFECRRSEESGKERSSMAQDSARASAPRQNTGE
jgi:hypothetical protein